MNGEFRDVLELFSVRVEREHLLPSGLQSFHHHLARALVQFEA